MPAPQPTNTPLGLGLLAAALALPAVQPAQAEGAPDRASLSLKALDYVDSQPDAKRVRVRAPALSLLLPFSTSAGAMGGEAAAQWALGATVVSDAISGASPAYHTSGLKKLQDHRRAYDLNLTRYAGDTSVTVGATVSTESDYFSRGLSLQASHSTEDHNTSFTGGIGFSSDRINPGNHVVENETKQVLDVLAGVTQVLSQQDIVQINLGLKRGRGYFSDPYKIFDNRPRKRDQGTLQLRWNHHFEAIGSTTRLAWRYYSDSFGIRAHTLGLEYVQPITQGWSVTPLLRLYTQSAARFYLDADPNAGPFVPNPPADALYYSQDQRLSGFGARTIGLKLAKQFGRDWMADIKYEHYRQMGSWRVFGGGSPDLATFSARTVQAGLSYQF